MKNPTIATVLNIIPGLGYVYIGGKKRLFGILLLVALAFSIANAFDPMLALSDDDPYYTAGFRIWDLLAVGSFIAPVIAFMYDAYQSATAHNVTIAPTSTKKLAHK